jgi:hypothetical protein
MTTSSEKERNELEELRSKLQERILDAMPDLGEVTGLDVLRRIRRFLLSAYDEELLTNPLNEIYEYVPNITASRDKVMITGGLIDGKKPFARSSDQARIKRSDGAWLHFTLTFRCSAKGKKDKIEELWAYDFEIVFPDEHSPSFVRFDLNEPEHENEEREIRSHMHPASDDLLVPAPVMTPEELLDVLVRRLRNSRGPEHPRH